MTHFEKLLFCSGGNFYGTYTRIIVMPHIDIIERLEKDTHRKTRSLLPFWTRIGRMWISWLLAEYGLVGYDS